MQKFFARIMHEFRFNKNESRTIDEFLADMVKSAEFATLYAAQIPLPSGGDNSLLKGYVMVDATVIANLATSLANLGAKLAQVKAGNTTDFQPEIDQINTHLSQLDQTDEQLVSAVKGFVDAANGAGTDTPEPAPAPAPEPAPATAEAAPATDTAVS